MEDKRLEATARLLDVMTTLRRECPWDREQTFDSLRSNTIEETYELADAITDHNMEGIKEELGDLLLHVVFYSKLGEEAGAFDYAHELGMATILWCYLRNEGFRKDGVDYHASADLTGQANHLGVTIKADIVKQKLPVNNGGFRAIGFGKTRDEVYTKLTTEHPIDLCRYQVANGYMGRVGLINSGGESHGASDLQEAVMTAVVNKRAGGMGLISGRKAFQRPMKEGVALLNAIQDVYFDPEVTIA